MRSRCLSALAFVNLAFAAAPAGATPITVAFSGTVTETHDLSGTNRGAFAPGTAFSGSFTFDSELDAIDFEPDPRIGQYRPSSLLAPFDFSVSLGEASFVSLPLFDATGPFFQIEVFDGPVRASDRFPAQAFDSFRFGGGGFRTVGVPAEVDGGRVGIGLNLASQGNRALSSDSLLGVRFDLAQFQDASLTVTLGGSFVVVGRIERLAVVPEPGAAGLLALGLALLARRRFARA